MGETVWDGIVACMKEMFGEDSNELKDLKVEDSIRERIDSLEEVELIMACEERFDIEIPDEDIEGLRTFADVEKLVRGHKYPDEDVAVAPV